MNRIIVIKNENLFIRVNQIEYCRIVDNNNVKIVTHNLTLLIPTTNSKKLYNLIKCFIIDNTENYVLEID